MCPINREIAVHCGRNVHWQSRLAISCKTLNKPLISGSKQEEGRSRDGSFRTGTRLHPGFIRHSLDVPSYVT